MALFDVFIVVGIIGIVMCVGIMRREKRAATCRESAAELIWQMLKAGRMTGEEAGKLLSSLANWQ